MAKTDFFSSYESKYGEYKCEGQLSFEDLPELFSKEEEESELEVER